MPPGIHADNILFEKAEYINRSIANLTEATLLFDDWFQHVAPLSEVAHEHAEAGHG